MSLWIVLSLLALGGGAYWLSREGEFTTRRLPSDVQMGVLPRIILFLGDSLTASGYWQNVKLEGATTAGKGWKGKPIAFIMSQAQALLDSVHPTEVVLLAGVNNVARGQSIERIKDELRAAWAQIHAAGARVVAVKLTPWFGYRLFENADEGKKARATTLAINAFIDEMRGQEGGPDYVIDTAALGDDQGRLLKKYSWDKLHMIGKGYMKLAEIVQHSLQEMTPVTVTEAGKEEQPEAKPSHGRQAKCSESGPAAQQALWKVWNAVAKLVVTYFTGGTGTKFSNAAIDEYSKHVSSMPAQAFSAWINKASNDEVATWALANAKKHITKQFANRDKKFIETFTRLGVTPDVFADGTDLNAALLATLKWVLHPVSILVLSGNLEQSVLFGTLSPCRSQHAREALAQVLFGAGANAALGEGEKQALKDSKEHWKGQHPSDADRFARAVEVVFSALEGFKRSHNAEVQVGDEIWPGLQVVIDRLRAKLAHADALPEKKEEFNWRTVTFVYADDGKGGVKEAIVKAADLLPKSQLVDEKRIYFTTRTEGRTLSREEPEEEGTIVEAGADLPPPVQRAVDLFTDRLTRNDLAPAQTSYNAQNHTITFSFYTPFRAEKAADFLPGGYKTGSEIVYFKAAVLPEAVQAGQVPPMDQETPWTCGPTALRADLAHWGSLVEEGWLANFLGNIAVIGVRPRMLLKGARKLGFNAALSYFASVEALRPFLAHDVPVIVVVDSFLHPGKQGHYVVVTAVGPDTVTLMDPHVEGNQRVLSYADFDARWWNKQPSPEGPRIVRRLGIVVVPGGKDKTETEPATEPGVAAGQDAGPAPTGRTANLVYKGMPKWLDVVNRLKRVVNKDLATAFRGGVTSQAWDSAQDQLLTTTGKMHGKELATWYNHASNEEIVALRLGQLRQAVKVAREQDTKEVPYYDRLSLTNAVLSGPGDEALAAAFRYDLLAYDTSPQVPVQMQLHGLQALAILLYGGPAVLPLLDARLKVKPRNKSLHKEPDLTTLIDWANVTIAVLQAFKDAQGGGATEAGAWRPASQRVGVTARQMAVLEKARASVDPQDVLRAHFLARSLGFEDLAKALVQRHTRMVMAKQDVEAVQRAEAGHALGKRHQSLVEKAMPETKAGKKAEVETLDLNVDWIFEVEQLKQLWPLVKANRIDIPGLKQAWRLAEKLKADSVFLFQADPENHAFVDEAVEELRPRALAAIEGR